MNISVKFLIHEWDKIMDLKVKVEVVDITKLSQYCSYCSRVFIAGDSPALLFYIIGHGVSKFQSCCCGDFNFRISFIVYLCCCGSINSFRPSQLEIVPPPTGPQFIVLWYWLVNMCYCLLHCTVPFGRRLFKRFLQRLFAFPGVFFRGFLSVDSNVGPALPQQPRR